MTDEDGELLATIAFDGLDVRFGGGMWSVEEDGTTLGHSASLRSALRQAMDACKKSDTSADAIERRRLFTETFCDTTPPVPPSSAGSAGSDAARSEDSR